MDDLARVGSEWHFGSLKLDKRVSLSSESRLDQRINDESYDIIYNFSARLPETTSQLKIVPHTELDLDILSDPKIADLISLNNLKPIEERKSTTEPQAISRNTNPTPNLDVPTARSSRNPSFDDKFLNPNSSPRPSSITQYIEKQKNSRAVSVDQVKSSPRHVKGWSEDQKSISFIKRDIAIEGSNVSLIRPLDLSMDLENEMKARLDEGLSVLDKLILIIEDC